MGDIEVDDDVGDLLAWIGVAETKIPSLAEEAGLESIRDFSRYKTHEQVKVLVEAMRKRLPEKQRMHVSVGMQRKLRDIALWVEDFRRVSLEPRIPFTTNDNGDDIVDGGTFREMLQLASDREDSRKHMKDNSKTLSEAAMPKGIKDEKDWFEFCEMLVNYLTVILGVNGVPLAYVIRLEDAPDHATTWGPNQFTDQMIACAPLDGPYFQTDAQSVHVLLKKFLPTEELKSIVKQGERHKNGRRDFFNLRAFMVGAGNVSRRIGSVKALRQSLHYKNERAMKFTVFVTKLRHIYRVYFDEGREVSDADKVDDLLGKLNHQGLAPMKAHLLVQQISPDGLTFNDAVNQLALAVSQLPDVKNVRGIAQVDTAGAGRGKKSKLRRLKDGSIDTNYTYTKKEFRALSKEDSQKLFSARNEANGRDKSGGGGKKLDKATIAEIRSVVTEIVDQRQVSMVQAAPSEAEVVPTGQAGTSFGGREERMRERQRPRTPP